MLRVDLKIPLHVPHPSPFPSFSPGNHPHHPPEPDPNPFPRDTNRNSHPFAITTLARVPLQNLVMKFFNFAVHSHRNLTLKFLLAFFALSVPAKQARNFAKKFTANFARNFAPNCPCSKAETSPKTSLCRNPLLITTPCNPDPL